MDDEEYKLFVESAVDELDEKQYFLEAKYPFRLSTRWEFDVDSATLKLHDKENNLSLSCNVMEIGTFSPETRTWLWAWSNKWLPARLKDRALPLKQLQDITGREFFGLDVPFSADETMAWQLAAMSIRHLSSLGCFKAPLKDGRLHAFLGLDTVDAASR